MIQRGRNSAGALAAVATLPGQRYEPPEHLTAEQAAEWRAIASTKPAAWFSPDAHGMLEALCVHTVSLRRISAKINRYEAADDPAAAGALDRAYAQRERESRAVIAFARTLRITPQSRYRPDTAATAHARNNGDATLRKPWL